MSKRHKKTFLMEQKPNEIDSKQSIFTALKNFFNPDQYQFNEHKAANQPHFVDSCDNITQNSEIDVNEDLIYKNFLNFRTKTVSKIMIPRSDISAVRLESIESEVLSTILDDCHTRTLVYQDSLDNIVGFLNIKDLFSALAQDKPIIIKKLIRKHLVIVPSMSLMDVLSEMKKRKTHIAVVIDEYGGTDGIVTIEDIIGELVGKIEDEHVTEEVNQEAIKLINSNTIICNARVEIDKVEKILSIMLKKSDDYFETVGGLVLARAGYFPKVGTKIALDNNVFAEIIDANARSIKTVKLILR
ncbi:MAG: hemolysin family protein [Rickettsiaceae bacterium]|nr:hemolysin family protein [Rickettsiaceae bacterium]